jgi:hypothetical protein
MSVQVPSILEKFCPKTFKISQPKGSAHRRPPSSRPPFPNLSRPFSSPNITNSVAGLSLPAKISHSRATPSVHQSLYAAHHPPPTVRLRQRVSPTIQPISLNRTRFGRLRPPNDAHPPRHHTTSLFFFFFFFFFFWFTHLGFAWICWFWCLI